MPTEIELILEFKRLIRDWHKTLLDALEGEQITFGHIKTIHRVLDSMKEVIDAR